MAAGLSELEGVAMSGVQGMSDSFMIPTLHLKLEQKISGEVL